MSFWSVVYPPDWKEPPLNTIGDRVFHALLLSTWTFIYGTPTILFCGILRRYIEFGRAIWR
jgi:hypothetical protein